VAKISAPLIIQAAEDDKRINAMWPDFESALTEQGKRFERFVYEGTRHGFHNNSTPRYNEAAAKLAWERTVGLFKSELT
jgi:carboxymethylenebutenolidase